MRVRHNILIVALFLIFVTQTVIAKSSSQYHKITNAKGYSWNVLAEQGKRNTPTPTREIHLASTIETHFSPQSLSANLPLSPQVNSYSETLNRIDNLIEPLSSQKDANFLMVAGDLTPKSNSLSIHPSEDNFAKNNNPANEAAVASTCTVTSINDSGAGTLRNCLTNVSTGDTINFDAQVFPPATPQTISVLSTLPFITADSVTIDGSNAGVILNGITMSEGSGLVVYGANGTIIYGLQIGFFPWNGIEIIDGATNTTVGGDRSLGSGPHGRGNLLSNNGQIGIYLGRSDTTNNVIVGNYIGTNSTGQSSTGVQQVGIYVNNGTSQNTIGGTTAHERNVISGNSFAGIHIRSQGTANNRVLGNYIGTDVTGMSALPQKLGVLLTLQSQATVVGGNEAGAGNLISGNSEGGVWLELGTFNNQITGNYIGVDVTGNGRLDNKVGIVLNYGAHNNVIGGDTTSKRNIISGNTLIGIALEDTENDGTQNNQIIGNYIGTNAAGTAALSNFRGITIAYGAKNNVVGGNSIAKRNLISGNEYIGVQLQNSGTEYNVVSGNLIGTNATGLLALENGAGITISGAAQYNTIGGSTSATRNIISGNAEAGINLQNTNTSNNRIEGNYIGLTINGNKALPNQTGIAFDCGASNNVVGGSVVGMRNVISGNLQAGIQIIGRDNELPECISAPNTSHNRIQGNFIGMNSLGNSAIPNKWDGIALLFGAQNTIIGGETVGAGNVISGNEAAGVLLQDEGTTGNKVVGNLIGTDVTGTFSVANKKGVMIAFASSLNVIGGLTTHSRNIISGNREVGAEITAQATENQIIGNYIGTNKDGTDSLSNVIGIGIAFGAKNNQVGGLTSSERNVISGNEVVGVLIQDETTEHNHILGNFIGTSADGLVKIPNTTGIGIQKAASNNLIGGEENDAGNLISGNISGLKIFGSGTYSNTVQGNLIGTDVTGMNSLSNNIGVIIGEGAYDNIIGGRTATARNIISGNEFIGLQLQQAETSNNQVSGNYIGVDKTGQHALPNYVGVSLILGASNNLVGGATMEEGNLISGNMHIGIQIGGEGTTGNRVSGNFIGVNAEGIKSLSNLSGGVLIAEGASQNVIGGATTQERNLISGNLLAGVQIQHSGTVSNTVIGNYIGVTVDGNAPLGNGWGVVIGFGSHGNNIGGQDLGEENVISANRYGGVQLQNEGTSENIVVGNLIGTSANGQMARGNEDGIVLMSGVHHNIIGGTSKARNVISGNYITGVVINGEKTRENHILGNYIGSNKTGRVAIGNGNGIHIQNGASNNQIGKVDSGNLISGNGGVSVGEEGHGIWLKDSNTQNNIIAGNKIGLSTSPVSALPNSGHGIFIDEEVQNNTIGISNTIRFNGRAGIAIANSSANSHTITQNHIYDNTDAEILLIVPIASPSLARADNRIEISGTVPCPNCLIEIFGSTSFEPSGEKFLGTAKADSAGNFNKKDAVFRNWLYLSITTTDEKGTTVGFYVTPPLPIYLPRIINHKAGN